MEIAEVTVPITLSDGKTRRMRFNGNCMCAYEEATGKFFLGTVSELFEAVFPEGNKPDTTKLAQNPLEIVRRVSMVDLRALLWSTLHEYNAAGEPHWPLTIMQVGHMLQLKDVVPVFTAFLKGQSANSPTAEELGEFPAEVRSPDGSGSPQATAGNGGERGIRLPVDAFA